LNRELELDVFVICRHHPGNKALRKEKNIVKFSVVVLLQESGIYQLLHL
jgi:hypothetical protein